MRSILLAIVLMGAALAGCTSSDGSLNLNVTDAPGNIDDFSSLTVTVDKIVLHGKDAKDDTNESAKSTTYSPANATFDLTKLKTGNLTTIFGGKVPAGSYKKLTLYIRDAKGVLLNGTTVDVKTPSGRLFTNTDFTVEAGKETDFTFDIEVHLEGNGEYSLKPNATNTGVGKKTGAGAEMATATPTAKGK